MIAKKIREVGKKLDNKKDKAIVSTAICCFTIFLSQELRAK